MRSRRVFSPRSFVLLAALPSAILTGGFGPASRANLNYDLSPRSMPGFASVRKSPTLRFLYRNPSGLRLQATVSQCREEINPARELTTEALAKQYVDNTNLKLPGFQARALGQAGDFRLVWRKGPNRTMLTGLQVKGNTVVVVSLIGSSGSESELLAHRRRFVQYLRQADLKPVDSAISRESK